jgi:hypothetical protein
VSSKSSGRENDSTGLRAEAKLNTPLSRCASLENTRSLRRFRRDTANCKKGEPSGSPFALDREKIQNLEISGELGCLVAMRPMHSGFVGVMMRPRVVMRTVVILDGCSRRHG